MSIGNSDYDADITLWHQVLIDDTNDTIVLSDTDLSSEQITLTHGVYFVATDDSGPSEYSYLLTEIESKVNAAVSTAGGGHTYAFELATPTSSTDYSNGGVTFETSDSTEFILEFSDSNFTAPPGIWGVRPDSTINVSTSVLGTSGSYTGSMTQAGRWQAPPSHYPHSLRHDDRAHTLSSGGSPQTRGTLATPPILHRPFEWYALPGAVVYEARAYDSGLASAASLAQNDANNGLDAAHEASAYRAVVTYGTPSSNVDPFEVSKREVVWLPTNGQFRDALTDVEGGERYSVSMALDVETRESAVSTDAYLG